MVHRCERDPKPWVVRADSIRLTQHVDGAELAPRAEYCQERAHYLPEWVTVKVAAAAIGRAPRTVYEWIENDRLAFRTNSDRVLEVLSKAVVRVEPTVRRGRPRGVPTRR